MTKPPERDFSCWRSQGSPWANSARLRCCTCLVHAYNSRVTHWYTPWGLTVKSHDLSGIKMGERAQCEHTGPRSKAVDGRHRLLALAVIGWLLSLEAASRGAAECLRGAGHCEICKRGTGSARACRAFGPERIAIANWQIAARSASLYG